MIHCPAGWRPNCLILGCENTRQKCLEFQAGSSESCFKVVTVLLLALDLSKLNSWRTHLTRLKFKLYTWLSINVRHMYLNRASFVSELPAAANPAKTQCLGRGNINIFSPLRLCRRQAPKGCRILGLHHHLRKDPCGCETYPNCTTVDKLRNTVRLCWHIHKLVIRIRGILVHSLRF